MLGLHCKSELCVALFGTSTHSSFEAGLTFEVSESAAQMQHMAACIGTCID